MTLGNTPNIAFSVGVKYDLTQNTCTTDIVYSGATVHATMLPLGRGLACGRYQATCYLTPLDAWLSPLVPRFVLLHPPRTLFSPN